MSNNAYATEQDADYFFLHSDKIPVIEEYRKKAEYYIDQYVEWIDEEND